MDRRSKWVSATLLVGATLAAVPTISPAQQRSLKDQLVGVWINVDHYNVLADGKRIQPQGPDGRGVFFLDPGGRFAWMLIRPDLPKFASNNRQQGTDAENRAIAQGVIAFYGTYTVGNSDNSLTMNIEYSSFPNFNGAQQRRSVKLENDQLTVINPAGASGGTAYVVWKRAN